MTCELHEYDVDSIAWPGESYIEILRVDVRVLDLKVLFRLICPSQPLLTSPFG